MKSLSGVRLACRYCGEEIAPGEACGHGVHHVRCCGGAWGMFRRVVLFATFILVSCSTSDARDRHDYKATAADLANCQCWDMSPAPQLQQCPKTGNAALDACMSIPPPDAGIPCGNYWAKTERPEGGRFARTMWYVNGHYSSRPSSGVCR